MSQVPPGHNHVAKPGDGGRRAFRRAALAMAAVAWLLTMAQIVRSEVLTRRESADVRDLVASARLTRQHASSRHVIRMREAVIGSLSSTVSGSRDEEQLAYVVDAELHGPLSLRLKGVVIASWDRRVDRFVLDFDFGGARHRVDGQRAADDVFEVRHRGPGGGPPDMWVLAEAPVLSPGPLPLPALSQEAIEHARSGEAPDPFGGSLTWDVSEPAVETLLVAGRERHARRQVLKAGGFTIVLHTEDSGFPLRLELPGGIVVELAEDGG